MEILDDLTGQSAVEDDQELTHAGDQSHGGRFTPGTQPRMKGPDRGIMPAGRQRHHVALSARIPDHPTPHGDRAAHR